MEDEYPIRHSERSEESSGTIVARIIMDSSLRC